MPEIVPRCFTVAPRMNTRLTLLGSTAAVCANQYCQSAWPVLEIPCQFEPKSVDRYSSVVAELETPMLAYNVLEAW